MPTTVARPSEPAATRSLTHFSQVLQASYSLPYPGAQSPGAVLLPVPVGGLLLAITIAVALFRRRATSLALLLTAQYRDTRGDARPALRKAAGH